MGSLVAREKLARLPDGFDDVRNGPFTMRVLQSPNSDLLAHCIEDRPGEGGIGVEVMSKLSVVQRLLGDEQLVDHHQDQHPVRVASIVEVVGDPWVLSNPLGESAPEFLRATRQRLVAISIPGTHRQRSCLDRPTLDEDATPQLIRVMSI
jgi:hypothetical protein